MYNVLSSFEMQCTGCGVCSIICPKNAIKLYENKEGFYSSKIDGNVCVNCEVCKKVCYKFLDESEDKDKFNIINSKAYLSYSKNENIRYKSSSGGVGREICNYGILNKYLICGARYNYDLNRVQHIIVENEKDLDLLTGSKYIPSYTIDALNKLNKEKKYIIFGTPCQIYGLRKYIQLKEINNIVLVDFFCHGVPSYNLWTKYLQYIRKKFKIHNIEKIDFRDKESGWHNYSMKICGDNKVYIKKHNKDIFSKFFLSDLCLKPSCYNCRLRFNKIYSDIRLGDFWGDMCREDEKGTSIVLTSTEKGREVLKALENSSFIKEVDIETLKESQYVPYIKKPKAYDEFRKDLLWHKSLRKLYFKYLFKDEVKKYIVLFPKKLYLKLFHQLKKTL